MARTLRSVVFYKGTMYRPYDSIPEEVAAEFGDHLWTENRDEVDDRNGPAGLVDTTIVPRESGTGFNRPWPSRDDSSAVPDEKAAADVPDADRSNASASADTEGGVAENAEAATPSSPSGGEPKAPPRSGKGSGLDAWRAHARELGIAVSETDDRDDVMAAVDAHHLAAREAQR